MTTTPATNALGHAFSRLPEGAAVGMIFLDRYAKGSPIGVHLVFSTAGSSDNDGHYTVGLFDAMDVLHALVTFDLIERLVSPVSFPNQGETLKAYVRAQVIPLEWKSMTDDELDARLVVLALPVPAVDVIRVKAAVEADEPGGYDVFFGGFATFEPDQA